MSCGAVDVRAPRFEHHGDAFGIAEARPRLSWEVAVAPGGWRQTAYEISYVSGAEEVRATCESTEQILVEWPFTQLRSRERGEVRVRLRGADNLWSEWSTPTAFETTLLSTDELMASMVSPSAIGGLEDPAPRLYCTFTVEGEPSQARLYITALGTYEVSLNGQRVGDHVLTPGWTSYRNRLLFQTYVVTGLLAEGENRIEVVLGNGWWRGNLGRPPRRDLYGERLGVLAQLEYRDPSGSLQAVVSDERWEAQDSEVLSDDLYNGQSVDLTQPSIRSDTVEVLPIERHTLVAQQAPPIRIVEEVPAKSIWRTEEGTLLADFGQNIVGWVRGEVTCLPHGREVAVRHAEVLEDGKLGTRPLRTAQATDTYYVAGAEEEVLEPRFTFHGFRYAELHGVEEDQLGTLTAVVISSDLRRTGWFECSDQRLNTLHDNVVRSARGNFIGIPTDCPQRDERLGWTGDIQVFAPTATYLFDSAGFLSSWLEDLALEQKSDGSVPYVVPDIHGRSTPAACGWGDAATVVPWVLYRRYGDIAVLERQYGSMRAWVEKVRGLAGADLLWSDGFQYGDWLDPTAPPHNPSAVMTPHTLVATAYFARSAEILAEAARALGRQADEAEYTRLTEDIREAFAGEFLSEKGRLVSESQAAYALALEFSLLPRRKQREHAARRLAELVRRSGFTIGTGFLGTPLILDALSRNGAEDEAYRMLLQEERPSWLYAVVMGATTIWERWDSMLPDGSINPGQMTSFNHYAFGAVADWMHRQIGGITVLEPGAARVRVAPAPGGGISFAQAAYLTPYGELRVEWSLLGTTFEAAITVPVGVRAEILLPGKGSLEEVGHGRHLRSIEIPGDVEARGRCSSGSPTMREALDDPVLWKEVCEIAHRYTAMTTSCEVAEAVHPYLDRPLLASARIAGHSTIRAEEKAMEEELRALLRQPRRPPA